MADNQLVLAVEFKSQVGPSFGNNFNNRTEEAIGNAEDVWIAYREGRFGTQPAPLLGYLFLLEDCAAVHTTVRNREVKLRGGSTVQGRSIVRGKVSSLVRASSAGAEVLERLPCPYQAAHPVRWHPTPVPDVSTIFRTLYCGHRGARPSLCCLARSIGSEQECACGG